MRSIKAAHLALKQGPASKLLKAQLSGIFQGIFSPAQILTGPVCQSVCVSSLCAGGQLACPNSSRLGTGWSWKVTPVEPQRSVRTRSPSVTLPIRTFESSDAAP